jgi:hypothetical protein
MSGQLAVRGAEIGSALVVKLLTFDLSLLVPVCLVAGTVMFMATERRDWRQFGRILVGIGLLLLSLDAPQARRSKRRAGRTRTARRAPVREVEDAGRTGGVGVHRQEGGGLSSAW